MSDDPLIFPGMPQFRNPPCPHCGATQHNQAAQYHYERRGDTLYPVMDGEICDNCGGLVPMT